MVRRTARYLAFMALMLFMLAGPAVTAAPYASQPLQTGAAGSAVVQLQRRLAALGYDPGAPDGEFGARTRKALTDFQTVSGLVPDGLADRWTLQAVERAEQWRTGRPYTVRSGDTLANIAQQNGTTLEQIAWLNQLSDLALTPGQRLRLPSSGPDASASGVADTSPGAARREGKTILGYYAEDFAGDTRSLDSLRRPGNPVNLVVNFQLHLATSGQIETHAYSSLKSEAERRNLAVQGLVHNLGGSGFDAGAAWAILSDPGIRSRAIGNLVQVATAQGLAGINIDIENVPPDQRQNYTAFVREAAERLHAAGLSLTLSIPAKTVDDKVSRWSGAFDYKALGQVADQIMIMAYDEHSPGWEPGPVASVGWFEQVARFAVSQIPRERLLMGIATYGYDWVAGTNSATGLSTTDAGKRAAQFGASIEWDDAAQVPYYTYWKNNQRHIVYYENAHSIRPKLEIVNQYHIPGIGVWRMGLEDPAIWPVISETLGIGGQ